MRKNRTLILPAVVVGLALIVVAIVYFVDSADALPSFFPGHQAGSSHHHIKHGIAALCLGAAALILAWFQTGPTDRTQRRAAR
jgi:amino acid permease